MSERTDAQAPPDVTDEVTAPPAAAESVEDYYARIAAAAGPDGRLPVAVEEMPGWDIYPYEVDSLRLKPVQPPAEEEPARRGEQAADCWCAQPDAKAPESTPDADARLVWNNDRWRLTLTTDTGLPVMLVLTPLEHHDLPSLPADLAAEMGQLVVAVSDGVEHVPSVGRVQLAKYGDGGAHLHLFFLGRPARMLQFRGSPLIDWEENLPRVPLDVLQANARVVAERLVVHVGGRAGRLGR
jgi:diadenosine tetraphosphate (Ap4A) HIT family hydrolase